MRGQRSSMQELARQVVIERALEVMPLDDALEAVGLGYAALGGGGMNYDYVLNGGPGGSMKTDCPFCLFGEPKNARYYGDHIFCFQEWRSYDSVGVIAWHFEESRYDAAVWILVQKAAQEGKCKVSDAEARDLLHGL